MKEYMRILNNWGTSTNYSEALNKRIYLSNQLAVILIFPFSCFLLSTLVFELYCHFACLSVTLIAFLSVPLLNRHGYTNAARVLLCLGPTLMITIAAIATETYSQEKNVMVAVAPRAFILSMAVLPLVIFNYEHGKLMWGIFIINSICVLFFDEIHYMFGVEINQMEFNAWKYEWFRTTISIAFITITLFLFVFQEISEKFQNKVEIQKKELLALNRLKGRLLGIVSHDLKGPVNSLQGVLSLLSVKGLSLQQLSELAPELNEKITATVDTMDNLLRWAMAQMDGLQLNFNSVNLFDITNETIKFLEVNAQKKYLNIENNIDKSLQVHADAEMTKIIIRNLLTNAIKFSPRNASIYIENDVLANEKVSISIIDQGVGMDSDELDKLFGTQSHFTKLGTQNEKGSGLGLLLCKELVEKQGGEIEVKSKKSEGSTFSFTLLKSQITNQSQENLAIMES